MHEAILLSWLAWKEDGQMAFHTHPLPPLIALMDPHTHQEGYDSRTCRDPQGQAASPLPPDVKVVTSSIPTFLRICKQMEVSQVGVPIYLKDVIRWSPHAARQKGDALTMIAEGSNDRACNAGIYRGALCPCPYALHNKVVC